MARVATFVGAAVLWVVSGSLPATEAAGPVGAEAANPLFALMPELRQAAAPTWVKAGLRLTFYSAAASVPGNPYDYTRDNKGDWADKNGRRWNRSDSPGPGGHGFTQVNVVALDATTAVLDIRSYGFVNLTQGPILHSIACHIGVPGAGADYWVNPAALQGLAERRTVDVVVMRMPYTVEGRTYQAIRLQANQPTGHVAAVYDLKTGVLLHSNSAVTTAATTLPKDPQQGHTLQGSRTALVQTTFKSVRQLHVPWAAAAPPPWLATLARADYQGSATVVIPGSPVIPLPATMSARTTQRGPNWIRCTLTAALTAPAGMPSAPNALDRVSGPAQFGGMFLPTGAMAALRAGQTLDTDPHTRVTVTVAHVGPGPGGRNVVQVSEVGQGQRLDYFYDAASGMLVGYRDQNDHIRLVQQFQLVGTQ
ncbi:MAG: hypothetical protein ISS72_07695 [Candidatus Brocadiae bacterium]|nr:hypothetical protein [Candidatus Brocadiia bacterium]